jgi:hypothetical protein
MRLFFVIAIATAILSLAVALVLTVVTALAGAL